eukprot:768152-Hanusia_phi.AAC.4
MDQIQMNSQDESGVDIYLASEDELGSFMAGHEETLSVCDDFERKWFLPPLLGILISFLPALRIAGEKISVAFADEPARMYGELLRLCKDVVKVLQDTNHHEMSDAFKMLKTIAAEAVQRAEQYVSYTPVDGNLGPMPPSLEEYAAIDTTVAQNPELGTQIPAEVMPGPRRPEYKVKAPGRSNTTPGMFGNLFSGFGWKQAIHGGRIGVRKVPPNPVLCDQLCSNGFSRADVVKNDATKALEILTGMYTAFRVDEELLSQMEKLGFEREDVTLALKETKNEEVEALEILTDEGRLAALREKEEEKRKLDVFDEDEFEFVNLEPGDEGPRDIT